MGSIVTSGHIDNTNKEGRRLIKKSFQDVLCQLIAACVSNQIPVAWLLSNQNGIYTNFTQLAKKIYNEQEPE